MEKGLALDPGEVQSGTTSHSSNALRNHAMTWHCCAGNFPFTSRTEHNDQYYEKPRMTRPAEPLAYTHRPAPWMGKQTTNQAHYKPFNFEPKEQTGLSGTKGRPAEQPPANPFDFSTTYGTQFTPKDAPGREPTGKC